MSYNLKTLLMAESLALVCCFGDYVSRSIHSFRYTIIILKGLMLLTVFSIGQ